MKALEVTQQKGRGGGERYKGHFVRSRGPQETRKASKSNHRALGQNEVPFSKGLKRGNQHRSPLGQKVRS